MRVATAETTDSRPSLHQVQDWVRSHPDGVIIATGLAAVGTTMLVGGSLATTAGLAAVLATASGVILLEKLPRRLGDLSPVELPERVANFDVKGWLLKYQLLIDIGLSVGVFFAFPGVTGVIAAGLTGILASVGFRILSLLEDMKARRLQAQS